MAKESSFEEHMKKKGRKNSDRGRGSGRRDRPRFSKNRRDLEMTKVICSECGEKCEVPFKPTSTKPVYCSKCFEKHDKKGSGRDFDKIMKALKIN